MNGERPRVSIVIPAYNEDEQIIPILDRLFESVRLSCEVLVVVDTPADTTIPVVEEYALKEPRLRCLINTYGPGPANAIRFGIDAAAAPVAVVTMADGCDDARQIDELARLVERGVAVAAASRYMAGGQQVGGPVLKGTMSRMAGRSLRMLAHVAGVALDQLIPRVVVVGLPHLAVLGEVVHAHHGVAAPQQFLHHVSADEAGRSADQNFFHHFPRVSSGDGYPVARARSLSALSRGPNANRYQRR